MQKFLEYVTRFHPKFPKTIRGATDREIDTLERLVGRPLPENYRDFLSCMGHDTGGLTLAFGEGTTDITELIEWYKEGSETGENDTPEDAIVIGLNDITAPDIHLKVSPDLRIVFASGTLYAESFEKLLYRTVFLKYRPAMLAYSQILHSPNHERLFESAEHAALDLCLKRHWFSDCVYFCGEQKHTVVYINQYECSRLVVRVLSDRKSECERIGEVFINTIGVEPE